MNSSGKNVLHVVAWYPTKRNALDGVWILRHIESLTPYCTNSVLHIQVNPTGKFKLYRNSGPRLKQIVLDIPVRNWRVAEVLTTVLLLCSLMLTSRGRKADLLNVHIAYPLLIHYHLWKRLVTKPLIMTEHWSGYHFNFGIKDIRALNRIRRIHFQHIPVIAVSDALLLDIKNFSHNNSIEGFVVPNVANAEVFKRNNAEERHREAKRFFMVSYWKWPKDPFTLLEAFREVVRKKPHYTLRLGGNGPQMEEIQRRIIDYSLQDHVSLLGTLNSDAIAAELNDADAFLHSSAYETFSVVTAEALSCGTPVIISANGGVRELVHPDNGILLSENSVKSWIEAFRRFESMSFDRNRISIEAKKKFSETNVGEKYWNVLKRYLPQ